MKTRALPVLALLFLLPSLSRAAVSPPAPAIALDRAALAAQVKAETLYAWHAYEQYAWGHDELQPLSKKPKDWYGESLLMTPVDSLDTLLLMGLKDEGAKAPAL